MLYGIYLLAHDIWATVSQSSAQMMLNRAATNHSPNDTHSAHYVAICNLIHSFFYFVHYVMATVNLYTRMTLLSNRSCVCVCYERKSEPSHNNQPSEITFILHNKPAQHCCYPLAIRFAENWSHWRVRCTRTCSQPQKQWNKHRLPEYAKQIFVRACHYEKFFI